MNLNRLRDLYKEYPQQFWLLAGASFIDMTGNALVFPFFALFLTDKFDVSMTRVGVIFGVFAVAGMIGGTIGGALADRFGRKPIALSSLVLSACGNLCFALVPNFNLMYPLAAILGTIGSIGGPAWQAMMADLLPEDKRAEGFGIIRILFNLAVTFGPLIGGLLAGVSYLLLFSVDSLTSFITAAILLVYLRETRPESALDPATGESATPETLVQTFRGYRHVLRDTAFMTFTILGAVVWLVYFQMNTTLSVYLRDVHDIQPQGFGLLLSLNAIMVVLLQLSITRWLRNRGYPAMLILAAGTLLYAVGFSMFGYSSGYALFALAMIIITIGEMLIVPVGQALAAQMAREDMRGRYMAIFGFGFGVASGLGTWLAGLVISNLGHEWVWYFSGLIGGAAALGYMWLHLRLHGSERLADLMPDEAALPAGEPAT
ncbi:MAG: MFS transporter, partial [Anaerolineae bacterium]|nr:MFS transporter [Anaerolineae bacterium]